MNEPKISYVVKIAEYFDVLTDYLVGLSESCKKIIDNPIFQCYNKNINIFNQRHREVAKI